MKILALDDDPQITGLMKAYLSRFGHEVHAFSSPEAAWECFAAEGGQIPILILDFVLPGYSGTELLLKYLKASSGLRVLIVSGVVVDLSSLGEYRERVATLLKPFRAQELLEAVSLLHKEEKAGGTAAG